VWRLVNRGDGDGDGGIGVEAAEDY